MKVDIVTMHMINNYGSVLQTYALCEMFKKFDINPEVIDYYPDRLNNYGSLKQLYKDAKPFHKGVLKCILVSLVNWPSYKLQNKIFKPFKKKYIPLSEKYSSYCELCKRPPNADIYCTGSDQVWNNYLDHQNKFEKAYFLKFIPNGNYLKISYAASFGRSDFDNCELEEINKLLQDYDYISVREQSGVNVLNKSKIYRGDCVLDPTLMVEKDIWYDLLEDINANDYILVYKLHEDSIVSDIAIALGKKMNKKVIRVSTALHRRIKNGKTVMLPNVGEFLSYIINASLVVTDSFHATALSLNFNIPFISVKWKMFNDRVESLLEKVGLEDRMVENIEEAMQCKDNMNFTNANEKLALERQKSYEYFQKAIKKIL